MGNKDNFSLLEKVKENGTITLDELVQELTKSGVTGIQFNDLSLNIEKFLGEKSEVEKEKNFFDDNVVSSFGEGLLNDELKVPVPSKEEEPLKKDSLDRDYQFLDCIVEGSFEIEDAERILALIDEEIVKKYIIAKLNEKNYALKNYVYMLMDLRES